MHLRQRPNALAGWLLFGCASNEGLLWSLLRTAGAEWLLSGSASDCGLLRSLRRTARLLLCHLHTNVHQHLPHNRTCLRSTHNAMHSPGMVHFKMVITLSLMSSSGVVGGTLAEWSIASVVCLYRKGQTTEVAVHTTDQLSWYQLHTRCMPLGLLETFYNGLEAYCLQHCHHQPSALSLDTT